MTTRAGYREESAGEGAGRGGEGAHGRGRGSGNDELVNEAEGEN